MSVISSDARKSLTELLTNLMSPNNDLRSHAEDVLQQHTSGGEESLSLLLIGLAEEFLHGENESVCVDFSFPIAEIFRIFVFAKTLIFKPIPNYYLASRFCRYHFPSCCQQTSRNQRRHFVTFN